MQMRSRATSFAAAAAMAVLQATSTAGAATAKVVEGGNGIELPPPPPSPTMVITDSLHGAVFTDSYRWLEDQGSPMTRAWVAAQMKYTESYLSQVKIRPQLVERLTQLDQVDEFTTPRKAGDRYFFEKRPAGANQFSIYMREAWNGADRLLLDTARVSSDPNTSVAIEDIAQDGSLLVYGVRQGGADEVSLHVLDVNAGRDLPDVLPPARYGVSLAPDSKGFYYSRFSHQGTDVYFHTLGTPQPEDRYIFGREYEGRKLGELDLVGVSTTQDGHYLILSIAHGVPATRNDYLVRDLRRANAPLEKLVYGVEAHSYLSEANDRFFLLTNYNAANSRIVEVKPGTAAAEWKTVVPEGKEVMDGFSIVGGKLFVHRLHDVKPETTAYSFDGKEAGRLAYPGIGTGSGLSGRAQDMEGFYSYQSFPVPPAIYHYNLATGRSEVFARPNVPFDSSQYEVRQVFYTSKDGTRVPMFIAGRKGLRQDGKARLLMTAYGGFDVSLTPTFNPGYAWWMEQGGFVAMPNLRGGGEYGEAWHKAGMFEKKQNVFDDFFAAAHYLIDNHYTSTPGLAITGRSNGGLLMGAAMTQHPEFFGAIWCGYPLLDMLRYQNFLFGRLWTTEYGSAENAADYAWLIRYSPYQNVKPGTKFPAIMFWSGDSDTRVAPLHARKMTALVQSANGGNRPVLLHYSTQGGHSAGVSLKQLEQDRADELAFLFNETE